MSYSVKEMFATLQGEGAQSGRAAIFCRFTGCNLWSGREQDRTQAHCTFCDTDFIGLDGPGGGRFSTPDALATALQACWQHATHDDESQQHRYVVFTGGEPLLQLDPPLIEAVKAHGFTIAVETNGTLPAPTGIDWLCVSPKPGPELVQTSGDELKLVYPQEALPPSLFEAMDFAHFWLQPLDNENRLRHTEQAVRYCQAHPQWRLSLQTHKLIGIP
ncbi:MULTISPECIES: 7-carboxy-7-deazaguanine synthase [unclassified Saccharibacter]|uniref:7-carboxy-7-deazaguanine synthase n=1 Tax=unclassified Saccharibacter TaxID=2648722 RepID=UPI00132A9512|nr:MULTISPECIES: 7-carboxy-7-deazaguanine synthase [unclassified Saccharibacter]MXV36911.1 7-carboxy-7-deazaguanine synthase [Saccharibacter sp. EH611]MXV58599.1 7-carboxy-7-deazaguanine synthase [Saccharibacter sp. EH70]MXV66105.1 7-carboxy-7-deazaguanine synthase [Saccharibacter sp. EH60]